MCVHLSAYRNREDGKALDRQKSTDPKAIQISCLKPDRKIESGYNLIGAGEQEVASLWSATHTEEECMLMKSSEKITVGSREEHRLWCGVAEH